MRHQISDPRLRDTICGRSPKGGHGLIILLSKSSQMLSDAPKFVGLHLRLITTDQRLIFCALQRRVRILQCTNE